MTRPPDEPAIRIVHPPRDAPLTPRPGRGKLALAAAVGAAIGFLVGGITTGIGSGERSPATTALVGDLAEPGGGLAPIVTAPATTTPAATTSTVPGASPETAIADLVPSLDGTLLAAFPETRELWEWPAASPEATVQRLPPATGRAAWNAAGTTLAALAGSPPDQTLFLDDGDGALPVALGAFDFRWHATAPGRLAWLGAGENAPTLYVSEVSGTELTSEATTIAGAVRADARLAAWGDWGFAFVDGPAAALRVVTLDPSGRLLGVADGELLAVRADGLLLIRNPADAALFAAPALDQFVVAATTTRPAVWAPSGVRLASVVASSLGAAVQVDQLDGPSFRHVLGLDDAELVAWAGGDRFVIVWSSDAGSLVAGAEGPTPALVVVDLADRSTHAIPVPGRPSAVVVVP